MTRARSLDVDCPIDLIEASSAALAVRSLEDVKVAFPAAHAEPAFKLHVFPFLDVKIVLTAGVVGDKPHCLHAAKYIRIPGQPAPGNVISRG